MYSRLAAVIAAGVLAMTGLATGTANAAARPFTDTVRITGNFDNGEHGYWARPTYSRTVTISPAGDGVWSVALRDAGTFTTIRNAKSPEAGVTLGRPVPGTFSGTFDFTVTSRFKPSDRFVRPGYDFRCNPAVPNRGACPGMPKPTGEWPALYFPKGAQVSAGAWRWEYRTCAETWVNSSTGNNGDITGARCNRTVHADAPKVENPACDTSRGTLTVPSDRGVRYEVNGKAWRAGEHKVRPGRYVVTAHARDGYRLAGKDRWRLMVERATACPSPSPTVSPTVSPSPTTSPTEQPSEGVTPAAPEPQPTVTTTARVTVVNNIPVPSRVDTGLGGLAR